VDQAGGAGFGRGRAAVVDGGGAGVSVAPELLDGGQIGAGVEEFTSEGAAAVVRAELGDAGRGRAALDDPVQGRRTDPAAGRVDPAALVDRQEQRPGLVAAYGDPVLDLLVGLALAGRHGRPGIAGGLAKYDVPGPVRAWITADVRRPAAGARSAHLVR
jgi:hypothetical protein